MECPEDWISSRISGLKTRKCRYITGSKIQAKGPGRKKIGERAKKWHGSVTSSHYDIEFYVIWCRRKSAVIAGAEKLNWKY